MVGGWDTPNFPMNCVTPIQDRRFHLQLWKRKASFPGSVEIARERVTTEIQKQGVAFTAEMSQQDVSTVHLLLWDVQGKVVEQDVVSSYLASPDH